MPFFRLHAGDGGLCKNREASEGQRQKAMKVQKGCIWDRERANVWLMDGNRNQDNGGGGPGAH